MPKSPPADRPTAGAGKVMVWRVFYSFLTLPVGVFTLGRFRKKHAALLTDVCALAEMRKSASVGDGGTSSDLEPSTAT
jgi:hypothetical protein